jgi:hypothetical protein
MGHGGFHFRTPDGRRAKRATHLGLDLADETVRPKRSSPQGRLLQTEPEAGILFSFQHLPPLDGSER